MSAQATLRTATPTTETGNVVDVEAVAQTQAEGTVTGTNLPVKHQPAPVSTFVNNSGGALEGDWDEEDVKLPQLKIVNGNGPLSVKYSQGSVIYADEQLWEPPSNRPGAVVPMMRFVPVKLIKGFRENLSKEEMEDGVRPRTVSSREEALAIGGTIGYVNGQKGKWSPSCRVIMLLEEPEIKLQEHPGFTLMLDGKNYAPAIYYASNTGYNHFAKVIFNTGRSYLTGTDGITRYSSRFWELRVGKTGQDHVVFVPVPKLTRNETGPEVRQKCEMYAGTPVQAMEE